MTVSISIQRLLWLFFPLNIVSSSSPRRDVEVGYDGQSYVASQFSPDPHAKKDKLDLILKRKLQLSECILHDDPFQADHKPIVCYFCDLSQDIWEQQRLDPAALPSYRDMQGRSDHCSEHIYPMNLEKVAEAAKSYDAENGKSTSPVKGVLFHQPKSGSTVFMNAIIAAEGENSRVYSDHPALHSIGAACDQDGYSNDCDFDLQAKAMADVLYLLTRTNNEKESNVYFKMNPASTANIAVIKQGLYQLNPTKFDNINFQYLYRGDVDTVLAKSTKRRQNSCVRNRNNGSQELMKFIRSRGIDDVKSMSDEDICSAYFAYLHEVAISEFNKSDHRHSILRYETDILDQTRLLSLLPILYNIDLSADEHIMNAVVAQINKRTRGRGRSQGPWIPAEDEELVSNEVKVANLKYMKKSLENGNYIF